MPVFSAVGWMLKGGGGRPITPTDMGEEEFPVGTKREIIVRISSITLSTSSLTVSFNGIAVNESQQAELLKDPEATKVKVYFKINNHGWSNYYDSNRTINFTKTSQSISFNRGNFSPSVLESVENKKAEMYFAFRTNETLFKNGSDIDYKVTKT